ncbi:SMEK domain-containing protein [Roseateles sp. PN1]|uniref:SMEK domain-containing protein n=1 Tax=Roseateles sp. PN1 TaxID=3137372 RepID=UPI0031395F73
MLFATPEAFKEILIQLSVLRYVISASCKAGRTDPAKDAESFMCKLLNHVRGLGLVNLNTDDPRKAAIDLGSSANRLAIQVTATSSSKKVKDTIAKFFAHKLDKEYDALWILVLTTNKQDEKDYDCGDVKFNIFDIDDVLLWIEKMMELPNYNYHSLQQFIRSELPSIVAALAPPESLFARMEVIQGHPAESAKKFIEELYGDIDEPIAKQAVNEINSLYYYLQDECYLKLREFLFALVRFSKERDHWSGVLEIPPLKIETMVKMSQAHSNLMYQELHMKGIAEVEDDYPRMLHTRYYIESLDSNFFLMLKRFLKNDPAKLKAVLVDLDFRLLD